MVRRGSRGRYAGWNKGSGSCDEVTSKVLVGGQNGEFDLHCVEMVRGDILVKPRNADRRVELIPKPRSQTQCSLLA